MNSALAAPVVECRGLEKVFADTTAPVAVLRGVDLRVEPGDMMAVVGVSGVGKTTLLYVMGLLERPSAGELFFDGATVFGQMSDAELSTFRNRKIGFVFQFHHLIQEFTVLENVMMPCVIAGMTERAGRDAALAALAQLGIDHRADHKPGEVSGGEQQRAAVARALVMRPRLVLADEPTGNLDERTAAVMHDEFVRLNQELGITFVVVTHNEELARRMTRVVRLHDGRAEHLK